MLWFFFLFFVKLVFSLELELDKGWTLYGSHGNKKIVISDIVSPTNVQKELEKAGYIESILHSKNETPYIWIAIQNWTMEYTFKASYDFFVHSHVQLTFHGVDTVAAIRLNGELLGNTNNMFTRYSFNIRHMKFSDKNKISIEFYSPVRAALNAAQNNGNFNLPLLRPWSTEVCCLNMLRKVQTSFGWDNIPVIPTMGLWKPVVFEFYDAALIRDVGFTLGQDTTNWYVNFQVHFELGNAAFLRQEGTLTITFLDIKNSEYKTEECIQIVTDEFGEDMHAVTMQIPLTAIERWWPRNYGNQKMYNVLVEFKYNFPFVSKYSRKLVKVAFRIANIYTPPVDKYGLSFYFNINDVDIFAKGANILPLDVYPEQTYDKSKLRQIFRAAIESNMNMLRVWAGGYYESDEFYNLADELGILVWQDAAFPAATYPIDPAYCRSVTIELKQNVRRLQRHPSLVVYALNSEVEQALVDNRFLTGPKFDLYKDQYIKFFSETVQEAIASYDYWRQILYTTPGYGFEVPCDRSLFYTGTPSNPDYGDVHYISRSLTWNLWDYTYYTKARFISEFGYQSFPTKRSWDIVLNGTTDTIEDLVEYRQRVPNGHSYILTLIEKNLPPLKKSHKNYWNHLIYFSQISQAMQMKAQISTYRVERGRVENNFTMGALLWHLNDVWTAPTYSIMDSFGNYKIAWYYIKELFSDETVIGMVLNGKLEVFVINDTPHQRIYYVMVRVYKKNYLEPIHLNSYYCNISFKTVSLTRTVDLQKEIAAIDRNIKMNDLFIELKLFSEGNYDHLASDYEFFDFFKNTSNLENPKLQFDLVQQSCLKKEPKFRLVSIKIMISAPAFFIYLELLNRNITEYSFSKNGFVQTEPIQVVYLKFFDEIGGCKTKIHKADIKISNLMHY